MNYDIPFPPNLRLRLQWLCWVLWQRPLVCLVMPIAWPLKRLPASMYCIKRWFCVGSMRLLTANRENSISTFAMHTMAYSSSFYLEGSSQFQPKCQNLPFLEIEQVLPGNVWSSQKAHIEPWPWLPCLQQCCSKDSIEAPSHCYPRAETEFSD